MNAGGHGPEVGRVERGGDPTDAGRGVLETELNELRRENARLFDEARTDHLTGLPNRRRLFEDLDELSARRNHRSVAVSVLFIDVDRFREVNKAGGDEHGDRVLARVTDVLARACRPTDTVYRKGGEEFVAVLRGTTPAEATEVAERMRTAVESAAIPRSAVSEDTITVSVGVAGVHADAQADLYELTVLAGRRMRSAKSHGRNQVRGS
jgi:diguanylate cyclase (GGDEF)-like protein